MRTGPAILLCVLMAAAAARAQTLPATGDGRHAWAALGVGDEAALTLWHHAPGDPTDLIRRVEQLRGRLMSHHAVAAFEGSLWLVYRDGSVQQVRGEAGPAGQWVYHAATQRDLPRVAQLRGLAAGASGPWALVSVDDRQSLDALDAVPAAPPDEDLSELGVVLELPLGVLEQEASPSPVVEENEPEEASAGVEPGEQIPAASQGLPVDRLLHLTGGSWRPVALPGDWPGGARAVVVIEGGAARPVLVAQHTESGRRTTRLSVHEPRGENDWLRTDYELDAHRSDWTACFVAGQLVLAQREGVGDVTLGVLRNGAAHRLAQVAAPATATEWTLLPVASAAAVVHRTGGAEPGLHWTLVDLGGRTIRDVALAADPRADRAQRVQFVMMVIVVGLSLLMLLVFWQRDPRAHVPRLDAATTRIAQVWKRAAAAAIDMVPAVAAAVVYFGLTPAELRHLWHQRQIDPVEAAPAFVVIGLFTLYTLAAELITATTPGKKMLGLRVTNLAGARPRAWQVLARGLLKAFDLVAPLLLILPLLSPHRQRLGDLLARTVVVEPAEPGKMGTPRRRDAERKGLNPEGSDESDG